VSFLQHIKDYFSGSERITSRILQGQWYTQAAINITEKGLLLVPPMDLSPAHVNCARIIFINSPMALTAITGICAKLGVSILLDSILTYGTQGVPVFLKK